MSDAVIPAYLGWGTKAVLCSECKQPTKWVKGTGFVHEQRS